MQRFHIAGLELAVETERGDVVDALVEGWHGYASRPDREPDIVLSYRAIDGYLVAQPPGRIYPGYASHVDDEAHLVLERRDGRLVVDVPADRAAPVTGELTGMAAPWALEAAMRALYSFALPRRGGLLMHAAGVRFGDPARAFLFSGPSGAGKTTLATLFGAALGAERLGDDMTALLPDGAGGFVAHATPFAGELGPAPDGQAPLERIMFPVKGYRHHLTALAPAAALPRLLRNTVGFVDERATAERALAAAADLVAAVPAAVLEFRQDGGVVELLAPAASLVDTPVPHLS